MEKFEASDGLKKLQAADENSFLLRDDLFIIRSLKSCLRNQLTSKYETELLEVN